MRPPDPRKSYAVLVGVGSYTDDTHPPVPAAKNNIEALRDILTGSRGCVSPENCKIVLDPAFPRDVLEPVLKIGAKATDLFFFYYVGHGFYADSDALLLTLGMTANGAFLQKSTSLNWDDLRPVIRDGVAAARKVVVLDSCYSGLAANHLASGAPPLEIEGTYLLPSCPPRSTIKAGEPYTFFTGALLDVLLNGVADDSKYLTPKLIHAELARSLLRHRWNLPLPYKTGTVEDLPFLLNPAYRSSDELTLSNKFSRWRRKWALHRQQIVQNRADTKSKPASAPRVQTAPVDTTTSLAPPSVVEEDSCVEKDTTKTSVAKKGGAGGGVLLVVLIILGIAVFNSADKHQVGNLPLRGEAPVNDNGNLRYELRSGGMAIDSTFTLPTGLHYRKIRTSSVDVALAQGCRNIEFSLAIKVDGQERYSAGFKNGATGSAHISSTTLPTLDKVDLAAAGTTKELTVAAQATMDPGCTLNITLTSFEVVDSDTEWILGVV